MDKKGIIYLVPTPLSPEGIRQTAAIAQPVISHIRYFIVENIRTARRFLKAVDADFPIDDSVFLEMDKHDDFEFDEMFLQHAVEGKYIGVLSEAGCPAVADPGSKVVAAAHLWGITIKPLVGPNSMLMALMSSGFTGQNFTFHGYLPIETKERRNLILQIERGAEKGQTHIFMETPYRNNKLFEDLINWLKPTTELCIASNITASNEQIHTRLIADWKKRKPNLKKIPVVFVMGKSEIKNTK
ncbi:MAG: SAM-dependent methyltransferase [Chitinophagales bacterium]|nr:SAM-dependent methyltransferase [Chitinophagales bacterium]